MTSPDVLKVLVALARNLQLSARNLREKETLVAIHRKHKNAGLPLSESMAFQARAMHHALYNAFFIAKKAAGRRMF